MFALYKRVLPSIYFAFKNGYIPIVDMMHLPNQYFKDGRRFKDNVWEYYFEQPAGISLDDIKDSANIIIADPNESMDLEEYPALKNLDNCRELCQNYFGLTKFNKETQDYLDYNYEKICGGEKDILGIICRGTDYLNCKPYAHCVQPEPVVVLNKAKELYKRFNYKKIWLATEDLNIYNLFKNEFGDILLNNNQYKYADTSDKRIYQVDVKRKNHAYNLGREYLLSIYILMKCKYIIGGITAGTLGAMLLSNGFENQSFVYLWDLGQYGVKRKARYKSFFEKIFSIRNGYYEDKKHKVITILGIRLHIPVSIRVKNYIKHAFTPDK